MKTRTIPSGFRFAVLSLLLTLSLDARAQDAEIVLLLGKAEVRDSAQGQWRPATLQQKIAAGTFLRTGDGSQAALLLRDQTQVRLNAASTLQVSGVAVAGEGTTLQLVQGRMWAQAKQSFTGLLRSFTGVVSRAVLTTRAPLRVTTPTATVGIRGTDWEVSVDPAGTTTVTVLSGEVEVSNELGQVAVGPNEQATAERGKAPVKTLLTNARDRVQWVTAYRPAPRRWVPSPPAPLNGAVASIESGDYAAALPVLEREAKTSPQAALLLADLYIFFGRAADAIALLQPAARDGAGDPAATALQARALMVAGRTDEARTLLAAGAARPSGGDREVKLAQADLARLDGDGATALRLFSEVATAYPQSHEAWFGVGRVENEKENTGPARVALDEAIRLAPDTPGYPGERAALEALGSNLGTSRAAFAEALRRQPDDYLALTGLGVVQLKAGETDQALESFLKAGVIEPRFARAQLYVGVAYYQLGNRARAIESVRKAAELDPKDPLPWVVLNLIHGDALELRASIDAAREAQVRMPYLKSLNQILNDQKGSASVGASLAAQGMEEWARTYATDSYNPYWAGSALFLADRYATGFNKNTELYKGFLLDPSVFGASNRFSSLVATPGHYGSIGVRGQTGDFRQSSLIGSINGLSTAIVPIAYSLIADLAEGRAEPNTFQARGNNFTLGLGARPTHALGVFYFGTQTDVDGHFSGPAVPNAIGLPDDRLRQTSSRHDVGFGYRIGPTNQVLFKIGEGRQGTRLAGGLLDPVTNQQLIALTGGVLGQFAPRLDNYDADTRQTDAQLRHAFDLTPRVRMAWGYEQGDETRTLNYTRTYSHAFVPLFAPYRDLLMPRREFRSSDFYVSAKARPVDALELQLDVANQRFRANSRLDRSQEFFGLFTTPTTTTERDDFNEWNHRVGLRFSPAAGHQLRTVYQRWRRPVGTGTLGQTDTLGVPVEDRLVDTGGLMHRTRLQYDWQAADTLYLQAFADERRVTNLQSVSAGLFRLFGVTELDSLRTRKPVFAEPYDELERTPVFGEGRVSSGGLGANWLLSRELTLAARYTQSASRNTGAGFSGNSVPFIPKHYTNLAVFWQARARWLVGVSSTYRSERFSDEANTLRLTGGWNFGLRSYWETDDKRWSVEAVLNNLHADKSSAFEQHARFVISAIYRF